MKFIFNPFFNRCLGWRTKGTRKPNSKVLHCPLVALYENKQWPLIKASAKSLTCIQIWRHLWLFQTQSHLPQFFSSLPSEQSLMLSQRKAREMHRPSPHWNWKSAHEPDTWPRGPGRVQSSRDSSRLSLQSTRPSHTLPLDRQTSVGPQEKAVQFWQEASSLPSPQLSSPSQRKRWGKQRALLQVNSSSMHPRWPVERVVTWTQVSKAVSVLVLLTFPLKTKPAIFKPVMFKFHFLHVTPILLFFLCQLFIFDSVSSMNIYLYY